MLTDLRVNDIKNPIGIDTTPFFSWKMISKRNNTLQKSYIITVYDDAEHKNAIYSMSQTSQDSINIRYDGTLLPCRRYFWTVRAEDNYGNIHIPDETGYFETGLMSTEQDVWSGAQWIGSPFKGVNTDGLYTYTISAEFETDGETGIVIGGRNKDNYIAFIINKKKLKIREYCDNAWTSEIPETVVLGKKEYDINISDNTNMLKIDVNFNALSVEINNEKIIDNEKNILPRDITNMPRKQGLMKFGLKQETGCAYFSRIKIENSSDGSVLVYDSFKDDRGILSALGEVENGKLKVKNCFKMINPVPTVNVRKILNISKKPVRARLYASAMGFYDVYINNKRINKGSFNPGFTDYRKRIQYQVYDVTNELVAGENAIGAVCAKGYYTGFVGYCPFPMVYGKENAFIAKLVIEYGNGENLIVVTDKDWSYTGKGPICESDYQQGEYYDAEFEFDWTDKSDKRWTACGIKPWRKYAEPTNGKLDNEKFELSAQIGEPALEERIIPAIKAGEFPKGHFIYDLGQNIVGTVILKLNGKKGDSIKLRYGEMCSKNGRIYIKNLRSAACTDVYTFKGDTNGEIFKPRFTSHGFRYIEITGNGRTLSAEEAESMVLDIKGIVLTNTVETAGNFCCSDDDINKLQNNIRFGQIGNSLLVFTDCPQRNERMGWTGDAQVFAATAAYNMNVKTFMNKWLLDLRDAQLLYNRSGAVPDTAPLGGDNRPMGGCGGWGDAAVIVPWVMYTEYGDVSILRDSYNSMKAWVDYQSLNERQNRGERTVHGKSAVSNTAKEAYIQIQQSRGDHLAYDSTTPFILTATAYAAHSAEILAKTAEILGNKSDADKYMKRYENIKRAFNEAWVKDDGSVAYIGEQSKSEKDSRGNIINETYYSHSSANIPSQTAYATAIDFGLLPMDKSDRIRECFKETMDAHDKKLSVGFLGISHLAPALVKVGLPEYAFSLLEERRNPSWLYSVINGATTIWERWSSYIAETDTFGDVSMNSFNHYAYGAIGEWMMGYIAGIKTLLPGYKKIKIEPHIGGHLKFAKAWHNTPYGTVRSEWRTDENEACFKFEIPANTTAEVILPKNGKKEYGSGEYTVKINLDA